MRTQYWLFFALAGMAVVAVACLIAILTGPHASAQPIGGATYTGTHSGGGTIEFQVSPDRTDVENLTLTKVPCDGEELIWPPIVTIPIVDDAFSATVIGTTITGSFPSPGILYGCTTPTREHPLFPARYLHYILVAVTLQ